MNVWQFVKRKNKNCEHKIYADMGRYCILCGEHGPCEGSSLEELFDHLDRLHNFPTPILENKIFYLFDGKNQVCNYCIEDLDIKFED